MRENNAGRSPFSGSTCRWSSLPTGMSGRHCSYRRLRFLRAQALVNVRRRRTAAIFTAGTSSRCNRCGGQQAKLVDLAGCFIDACSQSPQIAGNMTTC